MKIKSLLFVACFSLFSSAFAVNLHNNANANEQDKKDVAKTASYPGYCQIEVINDSYSDLHVYGTYDDGATIDFYVYRWEAPHYINLYYYGYCHSGMYISIYSPYSTVYSDWTSVNSTLRIVPYLRNQAKAEVSKR